MMGMSFSKGELGGNFKGKKILKKNLLCHFFSGTKINKQFFEAISKNFIRIHSKILRIEFFLSYIISTASTNISTNGFAISWCNFVINEVLATASNKGLSVSNFSTVEIRIGFSLGCRVV